jgi:hypothetical protein
MYHCVDPYILSLLGRALAPAEANDLIGERGEP